MKIYGIDENMLLDVPITSAAEHEQELSKSDYVRLSWVSDKKQILPVGSYIIPFDDGLKYRLLEPYIPNQNSEIEWKYEPEFQHPLMWLSKIPFTYTTIDSSLDLSYVSQDWPYLGLTTTLLQLVVDKINELFGFTTEEEKFTYLIVGNVDTTVNVTFSSTDILSALSTIAGACISEDVEWHISWENKCLYFGQIAFDKGESTPLLKVGENIGKVSVTNTKEGYYNVFFPQGSTRNISTRLSNGHYIASSLRLSLNFPKYATCAYPDGTIDARNDKNEPKQILALTFDDVYPHVDCYVYDVRSRTATLKENGEEKLDSNGNPIKYSIWYLRLAYPLTTENEDCIKKEDGTSYTTSDIEYDLNGNKKAVIHYWYDYFVDAKKDVIDGYEPCIQFVANSQPGALDQPLLGQPTATEGFEVICHQNDTTIELDNGKKVYKGDFEIKYSQNGDVIVPTTKSEGLYPRGEKFPVLTANKVVVYNIALTDDEIKAAQDELLQKTKAEIVRRNSDLNNYSFSSYPHIFETQKTNLNLYIGRRVVFDDGAGLSLNTRVIKLVTKLDFPFEQEITVGNQKIKGAQTQLKEDVRTILSGNSVNGGGLNATQIRNLIRNIGGSLFLSKTDDDTAAGHIEFRKGLTSDEIARFKEGLQAGELAFFDKGVQFGNTFVPGLLGKGGKIDGGGNGELRSLKLWEWLEVPELRFNRVSVYTGIRWDTFGGGIIESVSPDENIETGTCKLKLEEGEFGAIAEGDLCMGIWHDTGGNATDNSDDNKGNFTFAGFKTVYFQITSVSGNQNETFTYMLRSSNEGGNGIHPFAGMHFAGRGNIKNTERQAFRYTTTEYSVALMNVSTWEFQPGNYFLITGNIEGFAMSAINSAGKEYTKVFHGHGTVLGNAYIYGKIDQFERAAYFCGVDQSRGGFLAPGEEEVCTVTVLNGYGLDVTDQFTLYSVTRNTGDAASDAMWNQTHTNVGNPFKIAFSDLGADGIHKVEAVFTVTATDEATDETAKSSELEYFS